MIVMKQLDQSQKTLGKRELSLLFLIGIAITFPAIGASIRHYIDNRLFPELGISMVFVLILFYLIRKYIMVVTFKIPQTDKYRVVYP